VRESGRRIAGLSAAIMATAAAFAAPAGAATISSEFDGTLDINAAAGETNAMTIGVAATADGSTVTIDDAGAPLTAGGGCQVANDGEVTCTVQGLYVVFVELGDANDSLAADNGDPSVQFTVVAGDGSDSVEVGPRGEICLDGDGGADRLTITTPSRSCTIDGGPGDDVLIGSDGYDRLYGGPDADTVLGQGGDDYVYGDDGDDRVHGGPGNEVIAEGGTGDDLVVGEAGHDLIDDGIGDDRLLGGAGADRFYSTFFFDDGGDVYDGGPGRDRLTYFCPTCRISLDNRANDGRPGEGDDVAVERVAIPSRVPRDPDDGDPGQSYGSGDDVLAGDAADNFLIAQRGDDRLNGGDGADLLRAGRGADVIHADDAAADLLVNCGPGEDVAFVDALDDPVGCERVIQSQPRRRK
jgi:Ca2+-binding RTX toxin-like protein